MRVRTGVLVLAVVLTALPGAPVGAQEAPDTIFVEKDGEDSAAAEVAARLSEVTPVGSTRVLLARDDEFADALASGVMQASAPLLLTSPAGLSDRVLERIEQLDPAEVVLLGGVHALPQAIADDLESRGYAVRRYAGDSRFETAAAIAAAEAPSATTAILVRAFAAPDATDPTQAFADALAAGALSAETGWPVLLTETAVLSAPTRDYMASSPITAVHIVGGAAAVSQGVADELAAADVVVGRIAGGSRAETAVEVAKARGAESAADAARVTLVDGQSPDAWAGGFAAAAHSALYDAPIVLGSPDGLPPETEAFLATGAPAFGQFDDGAGAYAQMPSDPEGVRLTCVIDASVCRIAREVIGLPPLEEVPASTEPFLTQLHAEFAGRTAVSYPTLECTSTGLDGPSVNYVGGLRLTRLYLLTPDDTCTATLNAAPEFQQGDWTVTDNETGAIVASGTTATATFTVPADTVGLTIFWNGSWSGPPTTPATTSDQPLLANVLPEGSLTCDGVGYDELFVDVPAGTSCTAEVVEPGAQLLLVRPDQDDLIADSPLTFVVEEPFTAVWSSFGDQPGGSAAR